MFDHRRPEYDPAQEATANVVPIRHACPKCRERDMDALVWISDDQVRCQKCGEVYTLNAPERGNGTSQASE